MNKVRKSLYKSLKSQKLPKSKSMSKIASSKNNLRPSIKFASSKLNLIKLKSIEIIQRNWRYFFKNIILKKIIKIQSRYRGYNIRCIFNDIMILNKKLECFLYIIKITMLRHCIKFDYMRNKRIDYYSDHKKTKHFLLLQRRIRYFLFMKKITLLDKIGIFDGIYIKTLEYKKKIKSKETDDRLLARPMYKLHKPLSKIIIIQKNYREHLKYSKKLPRHYIDKISLNKCPLISKEIKIKNENTEDIYKNVKMRPINIQKDFYNKIYYKYYPLLLIQRKYKERFKNLKENYKLKKHSKIKRHVIHKHHYIYHATVKNETEKVLLIQKNIKYFLYRIHSIVNLIPKIKIPKCQIEKSYGFQEDIKKYFYIDFTNRFVSIIRRKFFSFYLKELLRIYKINKYNKKIVNSFNTESKRNSYIDHSVLQFPNTDKQFKRKETFNLGIQRAKPPINKLRHNSNIINSFDINSANKEKIINKKKVSFKDEKSRKDSINIIQKEGIYDDDHSPKTKVSKAPKKNASYNIARKKISFGTIRGSNFYRKK